MGRIHVVLDADEREAFRAAAAREGLSLSEWIRESARDRLRASRRRHLRTADDVLRLFAEVDASRGPADGHPPQEEDWAATKRRIAGSRSPAPPT